MNSGLQDNSARVAVIGAGSWGTTVACLGAANASTILWARRPELAVAMARTRLNADYLNDCALAESLQFTSDMAQAVSTADVVVMAVPSRGFGDVASKLVRYMPPAVPVVSLAKGLERNSLKRMTQVVAVCHENRPAAQAVDLLMQPRWRSEID